MSRAITFGDVPGPAPRAASARLEGERCWPACHSCQVARAAYAVRVQDGFEGYYCHACIERMPAWFRQSVMVMEIR